METEGIFKSIKKGITLSQIPKNKLCLVTDIKLPPEIVSYLGIDTFHISRGRTIPFATGLKLANPSLNLLLLMGDLITIGGNHFIQGARRNMDLTLICLNNFVYRTLVPKEVNLNTLKLYKAGQQPFNIPHLANSCGACYVARWTALHEEEISNSIKEGLNKKGFSVIEILLPGVDYYNGIKYTKEIISLLDSYYQNSITSHGKEPSLVDISSSIIVGKFIDKEAPTFLDLYNQQLKKVLGEKFEEYKGGVQNE